MKGTKIEIADDPETQRHLSNTKVQSQVCHNCCESNRFQLAYTGEEAKKKHQEDVRPQKIAAQPSGERSPQENGELLSQTLHETSLDEELEVLYPVQVELY